MPTPTAVQVNTSTIDAILSASPIVQMTLLCLLLMSVASWAIIVNKKKLFSKTLDADSRFEDIFWRAHSLDEVFEHVPEFAESTVANVFKAGYLELRKLADSNLGKFEEEDDDESSPEAPTNTRSIKDGGMRRLGGIDNLERSLQKEIEHQIARMETRLSFLATTGSTGPFIGLFGTVWGIMGAFHKIGATGMASLAVVAPGISEALITTAVGLVAAIPASIAYNHFVTQMRKCEIAMNSFSSDFLNIVKRNFFKE